MDIRAAEPIWQTETDAEASLIERLEAQVEALSRKVGRMERRQQRFTEMIRLLLAVHDQTAARLSALDGGLHPEERADLEELDSVADVRRAAPAARAPRTRRTAIHRADG